MAISWFRWLLGIQVQQFHDLEADAYDSDRELFISGGGIFLKDECVDDVLQE